MGDKISRRSFLKGTGKTILTAGALSSGIGLSTSTTPTTVIPKVLKAPPRLLSPKARAYRKFLKGLKVWTSVAAVPEKQTNTIKHEGKKSIIGSEVRSSGKLGNIIKKERIGTGKKQAIAGQSPARQAFEQSVGKGDWVGSRRYKGTSSVASNKIAQLINPNPQAHIPPAERNQKEAWRHSRLHHRISENIHKVGRGALSKQLRKYRKMRAELVKRGLVDKRKNTKIKGAKVGGGGKMALPGLESAKNPTGMSLVTQRYTL